MPNCFPQREIEGKITLHNDSGGGEELQTVADECVSLLSGISTSVSKIISIPHRPVHRFRGERKFRLQQENKITLNIGGRNRTYPVWGALFKDGQGSIGEIELKLYIASHLPPKQLGQHFSTGGKLRHLGYYIKNKLGYNITTRTGRTFHICADQCTIPGTFIPPLRQIEVEYKRSGSSIIPETLEAIQREIETIMDILSAGLRRPHIIGGPKKGKWFSEAIKL